jgi:hypothetical protein
MLSFKKILNSEFPLRLLPLDYLETLQEDDGFDLIVQTPTTLANDSVDISGSKKKNANSRLKKTQTSMKGANGDNN